MAKSKHWQWIPTHLTLVQFTQFVLPHLIVGRRGPAPKLDLYAIFNYILRLLYTGVQWKGVSRTQARACGAVLKMGVGLPEPACRSWFQTAQCCCVQKAWW